MRALLCSSLCNCYRSLKAADDEELVGEILDHIRRNHPAVPLDEAQVREIVSTRAYELKYVAVYEDGDGPDEEFGPEYY
jgi:predicted small metal-binding protein